MNHFGKWAEARQRFSLSDFTDLDKNAADEASRIHGRHARLHRYAKHCGQEALRAGLHGSTAKTGAPAQNGRVSMTRCTMLGNDSAIRCGDRAIRWSHFTAPRRDS
ncbi:MAG: hypothetical protein ACKVY0_14830, partial [Prosthecobacter sp.]|uniref:hypothetical protein n=1 Tax=Prosthecobacter sp. TaxID=1965333 RepID=UPI0038FD527D